MKASEYIDEYIHFLSDVRRKSGNTVDSYRRDITHYIGFITNSFGIDISEADRHMAEAYLHELSLSGKSVATVSRNVASIKSFHLYLLASGHASSNPMLSLEAPKQKKRLPSILSRTEIEQLLAAPALNDNKGIRDKAMLELLYASGMRVSEMIGLNVSDINLGTGSIRCHNTRKERVIPIGRAAIEAVAAYLRTARPNMIHTESEHSLFVNTKGTRLTRQGFWKILKHYGKEAHISSELTPHTLRHSFGAHLMHNGADAESVKEMMGHADIASTQVYSMILDEKLRDVYEKTHPRA